MGEDVDLSTRATIDQARVRFCPESRSGELCPKDCKALLRQRMRWAMGWDQVSMKHCCEILRSKSLTCGGRCGLLYMLVFRWFVVFFMALASIVEPVVAWDIFIRNHMGHEATTIYFVGPIPTCMMISFLCFIVTSAVAVVLIIVQERRHVFARQLLMVPIFPVFSFVYML